MNYFRCTVGGSGKGNTVVVTCASEFAGQTITLSKTGKTYTKTCPSTAPYIVTYYGVEAGTYTVSATVSGQTYSETVIVQDVSCVLNYGFTWKTWVDTAQYLDSTDYASLSEVLADEEAVRELFTEHACVDYMADSASANADLETVIDNDLCAKWINNRDYALDFLGANVVIKALMDTANKYGYGEWCLMPQVPKMTSNTAPYGEAILYGVTQQDYNIPYKVFDGTTSTWEGGSTSYGIGVGYHFVNPTIVKKFSFKDANPNPSYTQKVTAVRISGSNDNSNWTPLFEDDSRTEQYTLSTYDINNEEAFSYYKVEFKGGTQGLSGVIIQALQFYAYAPKGNVPVMTSDSAPYGTASSTSNYSGKAAYMVFDGNDSTVWADSGLASGSTASVIYKFVNPTKAKRLHILEDSDNRFAQVYVTASNDGTNYSADLCRSAKTNDDYYDLVNDDYYLYYKVSFIKRSDDKLNISTIQFYGRELKVSVPTMTSNTSPFGEVFSRSDSSGYQAYKAFDGNSSTAWADAQEGASAIGGYVGYKFTSPVNVKIVYCNIIGQGYKIQYSDNGINYTDTAMAKQNPISAWFEDLLVANVDYGAHKYWRLITTSAPGSSNNVKTLQFYGKDYSEKEFEAGTTKKWLYDHGVELETLDATRGIVTKNADSITLKVTSSSAASIGKNIDLTPYSLMRAKVGGFTAAYNYLVVSSNLSSSTADASAQITSANAPNNSSLDVSAFNQTKAAFAQAQQVADATLELTEFWLE